MSDSPRCFTIKNFSLHCGAVLSEAQLVYQTYGVMAGDRSNIVLYPTSYGAQHKDIDWLISRDSILDPSKWFIIIPNMFGNGLSSSPSNSTECKLGEQGFWFSHVDNVKAQKLLLQEVFGVENLRLIYGWSMGAQQAYHWGALYPESVDNIVALCATGKTTDHNRIFLLSLRAALTADPAWCGTHFNDIPERGFTAFARIYASWAASQAFYRLGIYYQLGYKSLEDYLVRAWLASYRRRDPHDLLGMIDTWLRCDLSDNLIYQGDYQGAFKAIKAKTLVMPSATDLYFTPDDCAAEAKLISNAQYREIPSIWGHRAGNPYQNPEDEAFIRNAVTELLIS